MATDRSKKARALAKKSENFVMLANKYSPSKHIVGTTSKKSQVDISNWIIYEKIDGVRAIFDKGQLYSRNGNKLYAPKEFLDLCKCYKQDLILDGELVHKDGFQTTVSIVKDQSKKATWEYWKNIKYVVFDYKTEQKFDFSFRAFNLAVNVNDQNPDNIGILKPIATVKTKKTIAHQLKIIENKGGEGLMLRNPKGTYELGRSWDLLKVKSFLDEEVTVLKHINGEGKHKDRLGKLVCKRDNGIEFECGTGFTDEERENPPAVGSRITIKYFEETDGGVPRFPIFITERSYD